MLADQHLGKLLAAIKCFNHLLNVRNIDAVTSGRATVDAHLKLLGARDKLHLRLRCTLDRGDDALSLMSQLFQGVEILTEDLEGYVTAGACDRFIHPHLHGLRELVGDTRDLAQRLLQALGELLLLVVARVLHLRDKRDVGVGLVLSHRFGREVRASKFGDDALHFRKALDRPLDFIADGDGLREGDARESLRRDDHRSFVESRHKLGTDEFQRSQGDDDKDKCGDENGLAVLRRLVERSFVSVPKPVEPGLFLCP